MSLDGALETFSFGNRGSVYLVAVREDVSLDLLLYLVVLGILKAELSHISLVGYAGLVKSTLLGFATSFSLLSTKPTCTAL